MKKIIITIFSLIVFISALAFLRVDIPFFQKTDGTNNLPLNSQAYTFKIKPTKDFNSLALKFVTYNTAIGGNITISIFKKGKTSPLVKHLINYRVEHASYHRFAFGMLKAGDYLVKIQGDSNVKYLLIVNNKENKVVGDKITEISPNLKIYSAKTVSNVVLTAAFRAANDWFRLGKLYLAALFVYLILLAVLIGNVLGGFSLKENSGPKQSGHRK